MRPVVAHYMIRCCAVTLLTLLFSAHAVSEAFRITDIRIEGLQRISPGTVFNVVPVSVNDVIDEAVVSEIARALFRTGNFDDVQVGRDGGVLVLMVAERPSISEINLDGNKAIETEALLDGLKGAGLAVGQVFQRSTLEQMRLSYSASMSVRAVMTLQLILRLSNRRATGSQSILTWMKGP